MTRHPFTDEQEKWLSEMWVKYGGDCVEMFNQTFNANRSYDTIRTHCRRKGYKCNKDVLTRRGRNNAGKHAPIGTIRINHGYKYIKIKDEKGKRGTNWVLYHRYVWEREHGEIPNDKYLIFLDGDAMNCDITNLALLPPAYVTLMNVYKLRSDNAQITKTAIVWCNLHEVLKEYESERSLYE